MFDFYQNRYELKKVLNSSEWPQAIDPDLLTYDETERAHSILYLMVGPDLLPQTNSLLDYGCGQSKVTEVAREYGVQNAVGYDIKGSDCTNFEEVKSKGPYDAILMNDVLDHLVGETLEEVITKATSVLSPEGHIFVRCHPYTSRTGTHLPSYGLNKAFAHLFFPELIGHKTLNIPHPNHTYKHAFWHCGLVIEYTILCKQKIDPFFTENEDLFRICKELAGNKECYAMQLNYAEYILRKPLATDLSTDSSNEESQQSSSPQ